MLTEYLFLADPDAPTTWAASPTSRSGQPETPEMATLRRRLGTGADCRTNSPYCFMHRCDVELARAWLTRARRYSEADIDAMRAPGGGMASRKQYEAVIEQWTAFGHLCRALNIRPYGSRVYRERCQWAWGTPERGNLFAGRSEWRIRCAREWAAQNNGGTGMASGLIFFGSPNHVKDHVRRGDGCRNVARGDEDCFGPTGELHRIWLKNNGTVDTRGVIWPGQVPGLFTHAGCGPAGSTDWAANPLYMNWRCTARGWERGYASDYYENEATLFYLPAMQWYWELLKPVLDHIAEIGPLGFIYEVKRDVMIWNAGTANALRIAPANLEGYAELRRNEDAVRRETRLTGIITTAGGVLSGLGGAIVTAAAAAGAAAAGIVAGAVLGAPVALMALLIAVYGLATAIYMDVFGRWEPVFEMFKIIDSDDVGVLREMMPPPPEGSREPTAPPPSGGGLFDGLFADLGRAASNTQPPPPPPPKQELRAPQNAYQSTPVSSRPTEQPAPTRSAVPWVLGALGIAGATAGVVAWRNRWFR